MSVVSLKSRTTEQLSLYQECRKSDRSLIYFDGRHVGEFSLEFTVGSRWQPSPSPERAHSLELVQDGELTIRPQSTVIVEVEETVSVPDNLFGIVLSKGELMREMAVFVAPGKIDPSFSGKLRLLLCNNTVDELTVKRGTVVGSATFVSTNSTSTASIVKLKDIGGVSTRKGWLRYFWKKIRTDSQFAFGASNIVLTIAFMLVTAATSSLAAVFFANSSNEEVYRRQGVQINELKAALDKMQKIHKNSVSGVDMEIK